MRKKIVVGNWKMNTSLEEAINLLVDINQFIEDENAIVCVPFTHIVTSIELAKSNLSIGAQNVSEYDDGAYTGEISARMLKSLGVDYTIVGHSERRKLFKESNQAIANKIAQLLKEKITPIFCCGEPLKEREAENELKYVENQLEESLFFLSIEAVQNVMIAYEPIWAIGTGKTASPVEAQTVHAHIRNLLSKKYGSEIANEVTILYGGSVKPENAKQLFDCKEIDGALVGGASLKADSFTDIIQAL
jgi:triosephosphate isomerase